MVFGQAAQVRIPVLVTNLDQVFGEKRFPVEK